MPSPNPSADVANLVRQVALAIEETHPSLKTYSQIDRDFAISQLMHGAHEAVSQLYTAVAADQTLGHLRAGWFEKGTGGGSVIQEHMLPCVLVGAALEGKDTEEQLATARRFAASRTSTVDTFALLAGVNVAHVVTLQEGLELIPWSQVPEGRGKEWFRDASDPARVPLGTFRQFAVRPTLAIRHRARNRQVLFASYEEACPSGEDVRLAETKAQYELTADVVRCITASAVWPIALLGNWSQLDDEFGDRLGGSSYHYSNSLFDMSVARTATDPLDRDKTARLFGQYAALDGEDKDVLRIGLDRLGVALRESALTDKAIDLGIALEAILLHGKDRIEQGEHKYRAAMRGATFLGGSRDERTAVFNLLKDAYDLRSSAVHTGRLVKKKIRGMSAAEILSAAAAKCAALAGKLIERGSFPDWEREYVVGND
jgi:Apea-like HEPN